MPGTEGSMAIVGGTDKYLTGQGTKKYLQSIGFVRSGMLICICANSPPVGTVLVDSFSEASI